MLAEGCQIQKLPKGYTYSSKFLFFAGRRMRKKRGRKRRKGRRKGKERKGGRNKTGGKQEGRKGIRSAPST